MIKTEKGSVIKRSPRYGVGKQVGNTIYLHKSVEDKLPMELLNKGKNKLPHNFVYDIIKYDEKNGNLTFISSPDWDSSDEPIVGNAFLIRGDGSTRYIKQKSSPQIYHHKWLFVNDDYSGFNVDDSKNRSIEWLKIPNIEFNKIGYKNYWDMNIVPHINESLVMKKELITEMSYTDISPEEIMRANKSSRSSGAVGPKAITPRMVLQYIKDTGNEDIKILDFGSGKDAKHTYALRELGLDVTAHDFSANIRDEHHDPNALDREYDIIFASNVLNVQGSESMMRRTIEDILKTMTNDSVFIANFPGSPRYGFQTAKEAKDVLEDYFDLVVIHGSDGGRTSSPVWAMTKKSEIVESFKWGEFKKKFLSEQVPPKENTDSNLLPPNLNIEPHVTDSINLVNYAHDKGLELKPMASTPKHRKKWTNLNISSKDIQKLMTALPTEYQIYIPELVSGVEPGSVFNKELIDFVVDIEDKTGLELIITAGNDKFHSWGYHDKGRAIDFVVDGGVSDSDHIKIESAVIDIIMSGKYDYPIGFINEYKNPSGHATGPHFHLSFGPPAEYSYFHFIDNKGRKPNEEGYNVKQPLMWRTGKVPSFITDKVNYVKKVNALHTSLKNLSLKNYCSIIVDVEDELIKTLTPEILPPHKNIENVKQWCASLMTDSEITSIPIKKFNEIPAKPTDMSSLDEYNRLLSLTKRELKKELKIAKKENNQEKIGYITYLIWEK